MNKKIGFFFFTFLILFSSCSHKVIRTGYDKNDKASESYAENCETRLVKFAAVDSVKFQRLGSIQLRDGGFSAQCSESKAVEILRKEACRLDANLINIVAEKKPGWSSCYQCDAVFYKVSADVLDQNFNLATPRKLSKAKEGGAGRVIATVAGVIVGAALGYYLASLLF